MRYFKILLANHPVGVISSDDFIFRTHNGQFRRTNDEAGQLAEYDNMLYHATWMKPVDYECNYIEAMVTPITEDEYKIFRKARESNDVVLQEQLEELEEKTSDMPVCNDPITFNSLEYIRDSKISQMSYECRTIIEQGFDIELNGAIRHFSLDTQDQLNLISLSAMAQTQPMIPYHADGESCIFYTAEEMNQIVAAATNFKIYHTTYYNALKGYINSLNDIHVISEIEYGIEIPEEYQSDVLKALQQ